MDGMLNGKELPDSVVRVDAQFCLFHVKLKMHSGMAMEACNRKCSSGSSGPWNASQALTHETSNLECMQKPDRQ